MKAFAGGSDDAPGDGRSEVICTALDGIKASKIAFSAARPWIAAADEGGNISVWDFQRDQPVFRNKIQHWEQQQQKQGAMNGQRSSEVLCLRFVSTDDCAAELAAARMDASSLRHQSSGGSSQAGRSGSKKATSCETGGNFLIVSTDQRLLVYDFGTLQCVPISLPDNKTVHAIEPLPSSDNIALGCDDGTVREWSLLQNRCRSRRAGAHTKQIVSLHSFLDRSTEEVQLASVSIDGSIALWGKGESPVAMVTKSHGGDKVVQSILAVCDGALVTLGQDKTAAWWSLKGLNEEQRIKLSIKPGCMGPIIRGDWGGKSLWVASKAGELKAAIQGDLDMAEYPMFDIVNVMPNVVTKKGIKIFDGASHPILPGIAAVATSTGILVFNCSSSKLPQGFLACPSSNNRANSFCVYSMHERMLNAYNLGLSSQQTMPSSMAIPPAVRPSISRVDVGRAAGKVPIIGGPCQSAGKLFSVWFQDSQSFVVHAAHTKAVLLTGSASAVAWDQGTLTFAYATAAENQQSTVAVESFTASSEGKFDKTSHSFPVSGKIAPGGLLGGKLLGVIVDGADACKWYTWDGSEASEPTPVPSAVAWSSKYCALCFNNTTTIFTHAKGTLKPIAEISGSFVSGQWMGDCFIMDTGLDIVAWHRASLSCQLFMVAATCGSNSDNASVYPSSYRRPPRPLNLLGIVQPAPTVPSYCVLAIDKMHRLHSIPLLDPLLRLCITAAARNVEALPGILQQCISRPDACAHILATTGFSRLAQSTPGATINGLVQAALASDDTAILPTLIGKMVSASGLQSWQWKVAMDAVTSCVKKQDFSNASLICSFFIECVLHARQLVILLCPNVDDDAVLLTIAKQSRILRVWEVYAAAACRIVELEVGEADQLIQPLIEARKFPLAAAIWIKSSSSSCPPQLSPWMSSWPQNSKSAGVADPASSFSFDVSVAEGDLLGGNQSVGEKNSSTTGLDDIFGEQSATTGETPGQDISDLSSFGNDLFSSEVTQPPIQTSDAPSFAESGYEDDDDNDTFGGASIGHRFGEDEPSQDPSSTGGDVMSSILLSDGVLDAVMEEEPENAGVANTIEEPEDKNDLLDLMGSQDQPDSHEHNESTEQQPPQRSLPAAPPKKSLPPPPIQAFESDRTNESSNQSDSAHHTEPVSDSSDQENTQATLQHSPGILDEDDIVYGANSFINMTSSEEQAGSPRLDNHLTSGILDRNTQIADTNDIESADGFGSSGFGEDAQDDAGPGADEHADDGFGSSGFGGKAQDVTNSPGIGSSPVVVSNIETDGSDSSGHSFEVVDPSSNQA